MKNQQFVVACGIGLAFVGLVVAGVSVQRGARVGLTGSILKVRTAPLEDGSSIVVLDFRFNNLGTCCLWCGASPSRWRKRTESSLKAERDRGDGCQAAFRCSALLGPKFTDTLAPSGTRFRGHTFQDRMVAARFDAPESRLETRKRFLLRIEEVDGLVTEIKER